MITALILQMCLYFSGLYLGLFFVVQFAIQVRIQIGMFELRTSLALSVSWVASHFVCCHIGFSWFLSKIFRSFSGFFFFVCVCVEFYWMTQGLVEGFTGFQLDVLFVQPFILQVHWVSSFTKFLLSLF